jgi:RES domain-containing protein
VRMLWRISNHCNLNGLGGEIADGRWHTAANGKRVVYLSEHPALALLETIVNLNGTPADFPNLLNPLHPDASGVEIDWCRWIAYDDRIFGIREKQ